MIEIHCVSSREFEIGPRGGVETRGGEAEWFEGQSGKKGEVVIEFVENAQKDVWWSQSIDWTIG